ncbi:hypothetical protein M011DRAFT_342582 [Sporormia fimetaria CBS 119925]|uniref:RING-type domain-containing protein n=1 Tax=Sporormia fimetaria CBS 119925 TaxID=1340428 RepID=A0A6A6VFC2_9PLEO|nr:hypothetical protein M011DRAFT_342582 [Sporormia fimetaria CBS 119925]
MWIQCYTEFGMHPEYAEYETFYPHLMRWYMVRMVEDSTSPLSRKAKESIAKVNMQGAFDWLWSKMRHYRAQQPRVPLSELGWRIFEYILEAAIVPGQDPTGKIKPVVERNFASWAGKTDYFRPLFPECEHFGVWQWRGSENRHSPKEEGYVHPSLVTPEMQVVNWRRVLAHGLEDKDCSICLCGYVDSVPAVSLIRCNHVFHLNCLGRWRDGGDVNSSRCPLCREPMWDIC